MFFRTLDEKEEQSFRKWARENYETDTPISGMWHPVIQDECVKMNAEQAVFMADNGSCYDENETRDSDYYNRERGKGLADK
jgi:hypothetical protein